MENPLENISDSEFAHLEQLMGQKSTPENAFEFSHVETFPDKYVGPRITITIHVRNKDRDAQPVEALRQRIEADLRVLNFMAKLRKA